MIEMKQNETNSLDFFVDSNDILYIGNFYLTNLR